MATTLYLVVSGHGTTAQVDRYLWFGAERVVTDSANLDEYNAVACVLRVTEDTEEQAQRRADAQADRLRSGLYGVIVTPYREDADKLVSNAYDVAVDHINARSTS
jgi:hypothetical protein